MNEAGKHCDIVLTLSAGDVTYGPTTILHVPGLSVAAGSILVLHGGNGSGKSSLLKAIAGVQASFTGSVLYRMLELRHLATHKRAASGIRFLPQGRRAFDRLSELGHTRLAARYLGRPNANDSHGNSLEQQNRPHAHPNNTRVAATFSGGEAKLLLLRSLTVAPVHLLLLDEPYAGLDQGAAALATATIQRCLTAGAACIAADHTGLVDTRFSRIIHRKLEPTHGGQTPFTLGKQT